MIAVINLMLGDGLAEEERLATKGAKEFIIKMPRCQNTNFPFHRSTNFM